MRTAIICGALALTITAAGAEDVKTTNYMLPGCKKVLTADARGEAYSKTTQEAFDAGFCAGAVSTVFSMRLILSDQFGCTDVPSGVTSIQTVRVVGHCDDEPSRPPQPLRL